uniref:VPS9 domain containing 1 n=1 Tax=Nothobranchius furzeri TaxID=105023 RepID=A0A8C6PU42_NOTFU
MLFLNLTSAVTDSPCIDAQHKADSLPKGAHHQVLPEADGELSPFLPPEVFQRFQTVASQDECKKGLTPLEEASRMNQKLKANYEARVARLAPGQAYQKTSLTLSLQRQMMENLIIAKARQDAVSFSSSCCCLRRFAASGAMTAEEREQRRLYANVLEYEQDHDWPKQWKANMKKNPDITLVSDLVSYLLSQSDHPVMKLLKKQQYTIYNKLYPIVSKGLPQSPAFPPGPFRSIHSLLHPGINQSQIFVRLGWRGETRTYLIISIFCPVCVKSLACSGLGGQSFSTDSSLSPLHSHDLNTNFDDEDVETDEPLTQETLDRENSFEDLEQFLSQLDWTPSCSSTDDTALDLEMACDPSVELDESHIEELEMRALKQHLKAIVKDIHIAIDQLLSLCLLSFECLNTARFKDLCLASIEEAFFTPLWSALVALFRRVNTEREQAFERNMKLLCDASPGDVGVPLKLFPQDPGALQGSYPYESAVQELGLLFKDCCPQRKLECIVRTLRLICACAEDYRCLQEVDSSPKTAAIGADDLLPILSFVALRCQRPQLVSECCALEEFIHEGYLIGEEGYCLTSLQSALAYVESLHTGAHLPVSKHI